MWMGPPRIALRHTELIDRPGLDSGGAMGLPADVRSQNERIVALALLLITKHTPDGPFSDQQSRQ
jgi:hypothetical protein